MSDSNKKAKTSHASTPPGSSKVSSIAAASGSTGNGSPATIDLDKVKAMWSPGREQRVGQNLTKVRSARDGPLRGGDWVLNKDGMAATLSFCFEYEEEKYGLTVGHLAEMDAPIFCFGENTLIPYPIPSDQDGEPIGPDEPGASYINLEIGCVVSKSIATDSLVFKFYDNISHMVTCSVLTLTPQSGLDRQLVLPDPAVRPILRPGVGTDLVGFGAQRRGAHGIVQCESVPTGSHRLVDGDISMSNPDDADKKVTDEGDCGTVFFGLDGTAFYFHHAGIDPNASRNRRASPLLSFGVPLAVVMSRHTELGGESEEDYQSQQQGAAVQKLRSISGSTALAAEVEHKLPRFKTTTYPRTGDQVDARFDLDHGLARPVQRGPAGSDDYAAFGEGLRVLPASVRGQIVRGQVSRDQIVRGQVRPEKSSTSKTK